MHSGRTLLPLFGLVALAACATPADDDATTRSESGGTLATPAPDPAAVRRSIDSLNAEVVTALKTKNATLLASRYDAEGAMMMSNMPAARGPAEIEKSSKEMFGGMDVKEFKLTTDDVTIGGDLAVETGHYEMTFTPKGAKEMTEKGKYITVWKRQADGSWKIFRDIANSDQPMG